MGVYRLQCYRFLAINLMVTEARTAMPQSLSPVQKQDDQNEIPHNNSPPYT